MGGKGSGGKRAGSGRKTTIGIKTMSRRDLQRRSRDWKREHPEARERDRVRLLAVKYGLSVEDFQELEKEQDSQCWICGEKPTRRLHVDHHHESGAIRGLLCSRCNSAIGLLRDRSDLCLAAAKYLDRPPGRFKKPTRPLLSLFEREE